MKHVTDAVRMTPVAFSGDQRPLSVSVAVGLLWTAWILSAASLCLNQIVFGGAEIGPGPALGILSLAVQAAMCVFIARGHSAARGVAVAFMVIAALPLQMLSDLVTQKAFFSVWYTLAGFVLKATSVALLFTPDSCQWFGRASGVANG
jgi:hypothetical protein